VFASRSDRGREGITDRALFGLAAEDRLGNDQAFSGWGAGSYTILSTASALAAPEHFAPKWFDYRELSPAAENQ
jgi:hypothetical protein